MANDSKKASQLPVAANAAATDRILILRDPLGAPSLRTVNVSTLAANLTIAYSTPANSSANGVAGMLMVDDTYLYVCVSQNDWKRVTLETW